MTRCSTWDRGSINKISIIYSSIRVCILSRCAWDRESISLSLSYCICDKNLPMPFYIIVTAYGIYETHMVCCRLHFTTRVLSILILSKWRSQRGLNFPVRKLIVCNLEEAIQFFGLIMGSPFKVYCIFISRILNITVFTHIIICANFIFFSTKWSSDREGEYFIWNQP